MDIDFSLEIEEQKGKEINKLEWQNKSNLFNPINKHSLLEY